MAAPASAADLVLLHSAGSLRLALTEVIAAYEPMAGVKVQLIGAPSSAVPPKERVAYSWHLAEGRADIFLTYCNNGMAAQAEVPGQQIVQLPDDLAVGADYGMTVMADAPAAAYRFAMFILSPAGQQVLAKHGFSAPGLPQ